MIDRHGKRFGDFMVTELIDFIENEHAAMKFGKLVQGGAEPAAEELLIHPLAGLSGAILGMFPERFVILQNRKRPAGATADDVQTAIAGQLHDPGPAMIQADGGEASPNAKQDLLGCVLGIGVVPQHGAGKPVNGVAIAAAEKVKFQFT
jgi:hypothetical protein